MSKMSSRSPTYTLIIILAGIIWGLIAFYFGSIFGIAVIDEQKPQWYVILNYIFDAVPHIALIWLCFRNWQLPQILSARNIWLLFGLRSIFVIIANLFFGYWEIILQRSPDISLADPFYVCSYLFLLSGMFLAVKTRPVRLKVWHYSGIAAILVFGIWLGWLSSFAPNVEQAQLASVASRNPTIMVASTTFDDRIPQWVLSIEDRLQPFAESLSLSYVVFDIVLLVLAGTLVLTFWGGQLSRTWVVITLASFLLYAADVRYAYIVARGNFETGGLLDTLWIFSTILYGIGAALEYDLSINSRSRRR
jgi:hypothetical protein